MASIDTDSARELRDVVGDDATATFEDDPTFVESNPTESASTENVTVQRDTDDLEDGEDEDADEDLDEDEDEELQDDDDEAVDAEDEDDEEDDEDEDTDEEEGDEDDAAEVAASPALPADGWSAIALSGNTSAKQLGV